MAESCYRTLQCAHILRKHQTESLSTHIAVSCGEMKMALLGNCCRITFMLDARSSIICRKYIIYNICYTYLTLVELVTLIFNSIVIIMLYMNEIFRY